MQLLDKVVVPVVCNDISPALGQGCRPIVCTDNALVQTRSSMSFPQVQLLDKVVVPVVCHDKCPGPDFMVIPQLQFLEKVVVPVVCNDRQVQNSIEILQVQFVDKVFTPVVRNDRCDDGPDSAEHRRDSAGGVRGQGVHAVVRNDRCDESRQFR